MVRFFGKVAAIMGRINNGALSFETWRELAGEGYLFNKNLMCYSFSDDQWKFDHVFQFT